MGCSERRGLFCELFGLLLWLWLYFNLGIGLCIVAYYSLKIKYQRWFILKNFFELELFVSRLV